MKIIIQKISLFVSLITLGFVANAQVIEISASASTLTQTIANGSTFDATNYMTIPINLKDYLPVTVSIKNTGTAALILTQVSGKYIVLSGSGASDFTINESSLTGTIAAGATQTFTVNLSASATNGTNRTVTMSITSNSSSNSTGGVYTGNIKYNLSGLTTAITKASDIGLSLYPNPSNDGQMHVTANNVVVNRIVVSNVSGQTEEFATTEFKTTFKGLLLVRLYTDKGIVSEKIIIQE
ncbi:T9SS type A sorting domain-containing protein [Cytophaga aurantiaca]|uniref:T9SS type A sorting domain-containing protein n=1 Tax=Cytophaga aurantiaca TaxID=29530 RepID=UPI000368E166|nr:T9SS type A sorting domain-containing protein [Cytophaga aurantiaca]